MADLTPVARVVYASESNLHDSIYAEMERIRASAVRHNVPAGVHTALLYQSGWFVQWKEGPANEIEQLMARIAQDPRHRNLCIVHSSIGPRLLFGPWSMAIVLADDSWEEMTARVQAARRRMEKGEQYSPTAVWRQLSTPVRHPGAAQLNNPEAFQRVTVCDARGQASFRLVQWLGHVNKVPVVHRRFAGDEGLDIGTEYVDFADGDRVARVIAMARKGLQLPLTRAFLADDSHILLLLSGNPQHDLTLVHRVVEACSGIAMPPVLIGVAPEPAMHHEPFGYAHSCGLIYLDANADPHDPPAVWAAVHPLLEQWRDAANSSIISRPAIAAA
jgi:hypothetical protein